MRSLAIILALILLCIPASLQASDWSEGDVAREIAWQLLHLADWGSTLEVARHPENYFERNPLLGRHPSVGRVNSYFATAAVGHLVVSWVLPKEWRPWWQWLTLGGTGLCVVNNLSLGLQIKF